MQKSDAFFTATKKHGIHHAACGARAADLLKSISKQSAPVILMRAKSNRGLQLGPLIRAGLVRFDVAEKHYAITPAGASWLAALRTHKLLP